LGALTRWNLGGTQEENGVPEMSPAKVIVSPSSF
jgi:hypothetical protein